MKNWIKEKLKFAVQHFSWKQAAFGLGVLAAEIAWNHFSGHNTNGMLFAATAYINAQRFGVQFEDRINKLVNIDPDDTPFMSMLQKSEAENVTVNWQNRILGTSNKDNAGVSGADVSNAAGDYNAPSGLLNYTQIPQRPFGASFTVDAVKKPGIGAGALSTFNDEKVLKLKLLKLDGEASLLSNNDRQQPLPESTQAGKLRGMQRWIATNVITATDPQWAGNKLSSAMFYALAKKCVDAGGRPETVFANSSARMAINEFVGSPRRDVDSLGKKIMHMIDVIESIAGPQQIVFSRELKDDSGQQTVLAMLEMKYWEYRALRAPQSFMKGLSGSRTDGWVEMEHTLVAWAEKSSGKIVGLAA